MTALHTVPISHTPETIAAHEHAWLVQSRHPTSEGIVVYVRCAECATRRVDLHHDTAMPPVALSRESPAESA